MEQRPGTILRVLRVKNNNKSCLGAPCQDHLSLTGTRVGAQWEEEEKKKLFNDQSLVAGEFFLILWPSAPIIWLKAMRSVTVLKLV